MKLRKFNFLIGIILLLFFKGVIVENTSKPFIIGYLSADVNTLRECSFSKITYNPKIN